MKQPIELVVFDIAGTTVEDKGEIAIAFQEALQAFGYKVPVEKINPLMGYKKTEAIKRLLKEYESKKEKISLEYIQKIHQLFLEQMMDFYASTVDLNPLPSAEKVFASLKERNIVVGLDTGFSKPITDIIIHRLGWLKDNKIDHVISSNEVIAGRPFPYMIEELMLKSKLKDAKKVIKVGDTEVDINEGKNAGCLYSIGVTTGAFTKEELAEYKPSFIIDDLKEIITIIDNIQ
ncbi:MAG: family hydrolase [Segetibacter sp.]|nr:family hydrolase [Segetibacter sp.]